MDLFGGVLPEPVLCLGCSMPYPRPEGLSCPVCVPPVIPGSSGVCAGPNCRACIWWVLTVQGARMPLDQVIVIDPESAEGDVVLEGSALSGWRARVMPEWEREKATGVRWRAHWGFCPDAELYRARPGAKPA